MNFQLIFFILCFAFNGWIFYHRFNQAYQFQSDKHSKVGVYSFLMMWTFSVFDLCHRVFSNERGLPEFLFGLGLLACAGFYSFAVLYLMRKAKHKESMSK